MGGMVVFGEDAGAVGGGEDEDCVDLVGGEAIVSILERRGGGGIGSGFITEMRERLGAIFADCGG